MTGANGEWGQRWHFNAFETLYMKGMNFSLQVYSKKCTYIYIAVQELSIAALRRHFLSSIFDFLMTYLFGKAELGFTEQLERPQRKKMGRHQKSLLWHKYSESWNITTVGILFGCCNCGHLKFPDHLINFKGWICTYVHPIKLSPKSFRTDTWVIPPK